MGTAPPKDAPSPAEQDAVSAEATFEPSPTGSSLCGFVPPAFSFSIALPSIPIPQFALPNLNLALMMNCDLADPIDAEFGGGRVATFDKDQDDQFVED